MLSVKIWRKKALDREEEEEEEEYISKLMLRHL
jgi:hypothetical protein